MPAARCGLVHCPKGELFPFCKHTSLCPYALPATSPTCPPPCVPAAHQRSGATDTETPCFVPPRWRPFHPDIPQIPYTFPPSG